MFLLVWVFMQCREGRRRRDVRRFPVPRQQQFRLARVRLVAELRLLLDGRQRERVLVVRTLVGGFVGVVGFVLSCCSAPILQIKLQVCEKHATEH